jgi:arsenate reductase
MSNITIYHNPQCGTSRNVLAMIRNTGVEPLVIEYLKTPPTRVKLQELLAHMQLPVRELLRQKGTPYDELGLADESLGDEVLLDAIVTHPVLMNRPVVVTPLGARLCRPSELVLDILPLPQQAAFFKEGGERVINERGERIG